MLKQLWNDELGVIISAELVLVLTICVLSMVVGMHAIAKAVTFELGDLASAFGAIEQSYEFNGFEHDNGDHSSTKGSEYDDAQDDCDCIEIVEINPTPKDDPSGTGQVESN